MTVLGVRACKADRTLFTDPIRASSPTRLHQQAGQKTAPDQRARTPNYLLQCGGHPQKTFGELGCPPRSGPAARRANMHLVAKSGSFGGTPTMIGRETKP